MPRARSRILTALASLMLLALCVAILYLGLRPAHRQTILSDMIQSVGHFASFGALALLMAVSLPSLVPQFRERPWLQYGVGGLVAAGGGALLELVQRFLPTRSASWSDFCADGLGILCALALLVVLDRPPVTRPWQAYVRRFALPIGLLLLLLGIWPMMHCAWDYWQRDRSFPLLIDFESRWYRRFEWLDDTASHSSPTTPLPAEWPTDRRHAVTEVWLRPGMDFPGIGIKEPFPDWHAYRYLRFEIYSFESQPQQLAIRIHDFQHNDDHYDRFSRVLEVAPGLQTFRVSLRDVQVAPRDRQLDLHSIDGLKLFAVRPQHPLHLLIADVRLEK